MTLKCNGHARNLSAFWELSESERADFDYMPEEERHDFRLFNYRGSWYDVYDCERWDHAPETSELRGWDGFFGESYFSAVVFKFAREWDGVTVNHDAVIVGYYFE